MVIDRDGTDSNSRLTIADADSGVALHAVVSGLVCGAIYLTIAGGFRYRFEQTDFAHHVLIADGMLHGRVSARDEAIAARAQQLHDSALREIEHQVRTTGSEISPAEREEIASNYARNARDHDWTIRDGRYYGYWGPMTSGVMIPFAAVAGLRASDRLANALFGAVNVALFYVWLRRFERIGGLAMSEGCRAALTLLFGFGTVHFYIACSGRVWFTSQLVTLTFVLLACIAVSGRRLNAASAASAGVCVALAALTRSVAGVLGLFVGCMIVIRTAESEAGRARSIVTRLIAFAIPCVIGAAVQLAYNHARFEDIREDGLAAQIRTTADPKFRDDFERYGLFSPTYLRRNVSSYFFAWQFPNDAGGRTTFDPDGNSMFIVTPAFLFLLVAWRTRSRYTLAVALGAAPLFILLLLFLGTGYVQFGNRYLLDELPLLLALVACGMRGRLTNVSFVLIVLSIAMQTFGVYAWNRAQFEPIESICRPETLTLGIAVAVSGRAMYVLLRPSSGPTAAA